MAIVVLVTAALTATIVGLTAALLLERARRQDLARLVEELRQRIACLERVDRNPLYREALEDQRARQIKAATDVATGVEYLVQAIRVLNPELLKKGKGK